MERLSVEECRTLLDTAGPRMLAKLIRTFSDDERAGVRDAVGRAQRRLAADRALEKRWRSLTELERALRDQGAGYVAGLDEVGRGALAGPLTAAAVVLPPDAVILGLDDSKRLTPAKREEFAAVIRTACVASCVSHVEAVDVDRLGVAEALRQAMRACLLGLAVVPDHLVVDGLPMRLGAIPETAVVGGDAKIAAIAAASVLAKVERDALMVGYDAKYPGYGFAHNKGYGSRDHLEAIDHIGLTPLHRRSYGPCGGTLPLFDE